MEAAAWRAPGMSTRLAMRYQMRTRFTLGAAVAMLALMLIGPSSVAAAGTGYHLEVMNNSCVNGVLTSNIKAVAGGGTPATRIEVGSYLQRLRGGHWRQVRFSLGFNAKDFQANGSRHFLIANATIQVDPGETLRMYYSFEISNGDTVLWDADIASVPCSVPA
jgi:hypothetical protein